MFIKLLQKAIFRSFRLIAIGMDGFSRILLDTHALTDYLH